MAGTDELRFLMEASQGGCASSRQVERHGTSHEPKLIPDDRHCISTE